MRTKLVEATQPEHFNYGKFLVGQFDSEWERAGLLEGSRSLLRGRGWRADALLVLDLETREGAVFYPGGSVHADLEKHRVWVCPMFEPFLQWLNENWPTDIEALPEVVELDAPGHMFGYRRPGPERNLSNDDHSTRTHDADVGERPPAARVHRHEVNEPAAAGPS